MRWRQNPEAARRAAERRQREDEAPRLAAMVPALQGLRLEVLEHSPGISHPEHTHVRHVVVASAPALFSVALLEVMSEPASVETVGGGASTVNESS